MTSQHAYAGRRVLVTGATGFLGRALARAALSQGAQTVGTLRDPVRAARLALDGIVWRPLDLAVPGALAALIDEVQPAVVFHLSGYGVAKDERDPERAERLNHGVLAELCDALRRTPGDPGWTGLRLVNAGSALEAEGLAGVLDEGREGMPRTVYGCTKLRGTLRVDGARREGLAAVTARLFTVFGPGERPGRLVPTLIAATRADGPIPLSAGTQERDWLHVDWVAEGLLRLGRVEAPRVLGRDVPFDAPALNLATSRLTSVRAFVETFADVFGIARERLRFGALPHLAEEMFHGAVPTARLEAALGWRPEAPLRVMLERLRTQVP